MASNDSRKVIVTGEYLDSEVLTWKIENFDQIRRLDQLLNLQRIKIELGHRANYPTEWIGALKSKAAENAETKTKQIGVYLSLKKVPEGCKDVIISFELRIKKPNFYAQYVRNFMKDGEILPQSWGFTTVVPADAKAENYLENGCLVLELEIKLFPATTTEKQASLSAADVENQYKTKFAEKLQYDMIKLVEKPMDTGNVEIKIISNDGVETSVAAAILSARSPVFEKMFQADMEESKNGIVKIPDLCSETVVLLLHFMYTGTLPVQWKSSSVLPELLYAAGKYQLPDLLAFLDDICGKICTKDNAGNLMGQTRRLGMKQAEVELMEFMRKNMSSLDELISFAEDCTVSNLFVNWLAEPAKAAGMGSDFIELSNSDICG